MEFESTELSFDCVLPSAIFFNRNLEPACIKCYALIRNLTKITGYCYASNAYLEGLMESDKSSVKRWLKSLSDEGYIEIQIDKQGIHWQRRIFLSDRFKKCLRRLKNEPPPAQNCAPPGSKMSHIKEEEKKEEKKIYKEGSASPPPSADAGVLFDFFLSKIKERNPEFKDPNRDKWLREMDLLLRNDKRDLKNTMALIEWAATHKWWKTACLSPAKLRKDFDAMNMQMQAEGEKDVVRVNRSYALQIKESYPEQLKSLSFDDKYAMNRKTGKEIPFTLPHETFKNAFLSLFGGQSI